MNTYNIGDTMNNKGLMQNISGLVAAAMTLVVLPANIAMAEGQSANEGFASLVPLILIMVIFWVLLIRPQQKRLKAHSEMISAIKKGDKVITGGGFFGEVIDVKETHLVVELAENVRVKVKQDTILDLQPND